MNNVAIVDAAVVLIQNGLVAEGREILLKSFSAPKKTVEISSQNAARGAVTRRLAAMRVGSVTMIPKSYSKKKIEGARSYLQYTLKVGKYSIRDRLVTRVA